MIGETISHYRILEKLGGGGMGVVYKAEDTRLKRTVALKFLKPELTDDEDTRTRFVHEAQAASALQHHNICTIHEIDQTPDGRMFICMDYYGGHTLKALTEREAMPLREAVEIAVQTADGLAKAHESNMVHRDIKPANIAITGDGVVKILDFGLAKLTDRTRVTKMGTTVGTVSYMSPEQARGDDVAAGADVWSLGVILYEMLTGRLPFPATHDAAVLYAIINEPYAPVTELRDEVPPSLAHIVDRALSKNPNERYSDAGEMARDLRNVAAEIDSSGRQTAASGGPGAPAQKRRARIWFPMAFIILIAAGFLFLKPVLFEDDLVSAPRPIAVISFENRTGDEQYDYLREVIPNLLITSLEQSNYLSVITWERMHDLLQQAGRGDVNVIDKETGFEVCAMDGVDTIVLGSFAKAGDVFVTDVKVLDVHSKELLKSVSAKGDGVGSILDSQIDKLGREISRGVGLSERAITAAGTQPITTVTTHSMDAYQYYLRGREAERKLYWDDARQALERAVALDSTFAVAWQELGYTYSKLRDINNRNKAFEKAIALSAQAPEKERLWIEYCYATTIEDDSDKATQLLIELTTKNPKEKDFFMQLGLVYGDKSMFEEAEEAFKKVLALDPEYGEALNALGYLYATLEDHSRAIEYFERYAAANPGDANPLDSMGEMYFRMGQLDKAISMFRQAIQVKPGFGSEVGISYVLALREDYAGAIDMGEQYIATASSPGMQVRGRFALIFFMTHGCRYQTAIGQLETIVQAAERLGYQWGISGLRWLESWTRYLMGDYQGSRECLDKSRSTAKAINRLGAWVSMIGNIADGMNDLKEGRIDEAKARFAAIDSTMALVPEESPAYTEYAEFAYAMYRAEIFLAEGMIDDCIEVCRKTPLPTIPNLGTASLFFYSYPADRDVLARAYIQKGSMDDAITEYERLITFDPDSKDRRLIFPLFHYRLAQLYEKKGLLDKATRRYEKFLEIMDGAEPELTEVTDTRRRLAALSGE